MKGLLSTLHLFLNVAFLQAQISLVNLAEGFNKPVSIAHANDHRLFIVEKAGRIALVDTLGNKAQDYFLDIRQRVKSSGGEQGLLGLAFHPDYANNGFFYVNYTGQNDSTTVSRFSVSSADPGKADENSEVVLLKIFQPFNNHNGGDIKFGPDGFLYIATGDGGAGGDPQNYSQNPLSLLGKMLRIDVNTLPYQIPGNNPFVTSPDTLDEIWALGLRNPWRFSFDRQTGDIWIADVGQNAWEEINYRAAGTLGGENYGWRCYEGTEPFNTNGCLPASHYVFPVHTYANTPTDCSVTGGFVYRGNRYPDIKGRYFYADYCSAKIWSLHRSNDTWNNQLQGDFDFNCSTLGEDAGGEIYVAAFDKGIIYRLQAGTASFNPQTKKKSPR
jgi:glucose/arabinose dehydrogenase